MVIHPLAGIDRIDGEKMTGIYRMIGLRTKAGLKAINSAIVASQYNSAIFRQKMIKVPKVGSA
jgi:hypothetical protein